MKRVNMAIVGATGAVGEVMIELLQERQFPVEELYLLASERSRGKSRPFQNRNLRVQSLADFDFSKVQIALFSAGSEVSRQYVPKATACGCLVIDNTSAFRLEADVPLVIPEVNGHRLEGDAPRRIIANPNCSTIQMLVALKPIYDRAGISRINVATYQSVSGAGRRGMEELAQQTARLLNAQPLEPGRLPVQIAFNLFPQIGDFEANGYTQDEMKLVRETRKILEDERIEVNPTCVRVPVFYGHSEAVHLETRSPISAAEVRALLADAPGVEVVDERESAGYPTPVSHAAGQDPVFVGRIRQDISHPLGIDLWIVSDNVRKGAALNSVQIAEVLIKRL